MSVPQALIALEEDRIEGKEAGRPQRYERLVSALLELLPTKGPTQLPEAGRIGYLFRQYKRRVAGGRRLETVPDRRDKSGTLWRVLRVR
jgi:hypothetical protein